MSQRNRLSASSLAVLANVDSAILRKTSRLSPHQCSANAIVRLPARHQQAQAAPYGGAARPRQPFHRLNPPAAGDGNSYRHYRRVPIE